MGVKNDEQSWWASPSNVASHFGTSGVAVATATGITHPLGFVALIVLFCLDAPINLLLKMIQLF
ncbi:hypothetical protein HanOQP8_Chr10g0353771 [Helianthus annuus]|nr:hypothetical protein HanOQP8_Chr10g0353771 [Helianthus annuus]